MKTILIVALITLAPKVIDHPVVRDVTDGWHKIENPTSYPVSITLHCGSDYENVVVEVEAKSTKSFEILRPNRHPAYCLIEKWSKRSRP